MKIQPFVGGKGSIRRTLNTYSTDITNTSVLAAYSAVHLEVKAIFLQVKEMSEQCSYLIKVDSAVAREGKERFPLSKRDIAGIAGQTWLDIRATVKPQKDVSTEVSKAYRR